MLIFFFFLILYKWTHIRIKQILKKIEFSWVQWAEMSKLSITTFSSCSKWPQKTKLEREHEFQQRFPIEIFVQQETCQHFCHRIVSRFHGQYQREDGISNYDSNYFEQVSKISWNWIFNGEESGWVNIFVKVSSLWFYHICVKNTFNTEMIWKVDLVEKSEKN